MSQTVRIGTRASALAQAQSRQVAERLQAIDPTLECTLVLITTTGDRAASGSPASTLAAASGGLKGLFTKELDEALLRGEIDLAVHSFKDVPTVLPEGFVFAAVPGREDAREAWISRERIPWRELPRGARVGTSSTRRRALLLRARPDVTVVPLRGNVDTRLRKLEEGAFDAILLAAAGLSRLGLADRITERLALDAFPPAPGQGALAIVAHERLLQAPENARLVAALGALNDTISRDAALCEHECLAALGGSCVTPIAVHAAWQEPHFEVRGLVASPDGKRVIEEQVLGLGYPFNPVTAGRKLANRLLDRGARALLNDEATREA